ncbi:MAG TPA: 16S rRNA (guanine(527)-N(7))-methyltransferase RsmG [Rhizomicrobium sp.]|jgi:16S rRNA (guanine527-N7)-methyltransferase
MTTFGPDDFQAAANVSRETLARLKLYVSLLEEWNRLHNLVSAASLAEVWQRHVWDSAQLAPFVPATAASLVDLGSGAGFPGLVLALLCDRPGFRVVLYESIAKKCTFLSEAARRLGLAVEIRNARAEDSPREIFDVITARACAPLPRLLSYATPFLAPASLCLFLKGQSVGSELTEAHKSWRMRVTEYPSRSHPSGTILVLEEVRHV